MRHLLAGLVIFSMTALPNLAHGDDQSIVQAIVQQMKQHQDLGHLKGFDISVKSNDGQVWLSGDVANQKQQTLALETARRVSGVKVVVNDLRLPDNVAKPQPVSGSQQASRVAAKNATNAVFRKNPATAISQQPQSRTASHQPRRLFGDVTGALRKAFTQNPKQPITQPRLPVATPQLAQAASQPLGISQKQAVPAASPMVPSRPVPAPRDVPRRAQRIGVVPAANSHVARVSQPVVQPAPARAITPVATPQADMSPQQVAAMAYAQQMAAVYAQQMAAYQQASQARRQHQTPMAFAASRGATPRDLSRLSAPLVAPAAMYQAAAGGAPVPAHVPGTGGGVAPVRYDNPNLPGYAWPSYAAHPNYAALTYPKQYSASAWPYIGPFYPYPQVPLGWRKVTLEWDDGWWMLDFQSK